MERPHSLLQRLSKIFLLAFLLSANAWAGESLPRLFWRDLKSPITTDARYTLAGGSAFTLVLVGMEDQVDTPFQDAMVAHKPLGKMATYGNWGGQMVPNAAYALGMWTAGQNKDAELMVRASAAAGAAVTVLKYVFREPRPNHNGHRDAMPSGHTTEAFAFASTVGCRHSLAWGVAAYSFAGFVGISRINGNDHTLHQVVAGAVLGTSYGLGVCWRDEGRSRPKNYVWSVLPTDGGVAGSFQYEF